MKCKEICDLLDEYILGELDPEIEIQMNEHLSACQSCKAKMYEKEATITALRKVTTFNPSAQALRRIRRSLIGQGRKQPFLWRFPKRFVYALAAFLFGIVLMRSVDILIFKQKQAPKAELKFETRHQEPFVDTVEFYHAPAKNVAKI
jgi:anti-sigma factor RsiW